MNKGPKAIHIGAPMLSSTSRLHAAERGSGGLRVTVHRALPTEHEFYDTIGRVVSEAAHLERMLDLIIWKFVGRAEGRRQEVGKLRSDIMTKLAAMRERKPTRPRVAHR